MAPGKLRDRFVDDAIHRMKELIKKIDKYNEQLNFDINSENTMKIEKEIQNERRKLLN